MRTRNGESLSELSKCGHTHLSNLTEQEVDVVIAFLIMELTVEGFARKFSNRLTVPG